MNSTYRKLKTEQVLALLSSCESKTTEEIRAHLIAEYSYVSKLLRDLHAAGLIQSAPYSTQRRRGKKWRITPTA